MPQRGNVMGSRSHCRQVSNDDSKRMMNTHILGGLPECVLVLDAGVPCLYAGDLVAGECIKKHPIAGDM